MKPHQLASQKFHAKRRDAGWKKVTVWLGPVSLVQLEMLRAECGSLDKAIAYAIRMCPTRDQVEKAEYD